MQSTLVKSTEMMIYVIPVLPYFRFIQMPVDDLQHVVTYGKRMRPVYVVRSQDPLVDANRPALLDEQVLTS
jgi:hypothetical protein